MLPTTLLIRMGTLLLFAFPVASLMNKSAPGAVLHAFAFMGLIRLVYLASDVKRRPVLKTFWQEYGVVCLVMAAPLILNLVSTASVGAFDRMFPVVLQRLAMTGFVLLALSRLPLRSVSFFQWGVIVAAIASSAILYRASNGGTIRPEVDAQNLLNYTNFIVLLGIYVVYMLNRRSGNYPVIEFTFKFLALISVGYAILLSESRGPLLSLVVLLLLFGLFGLRNVAWRWRVIGSIVMLVIGGVATLQSDTMVERFQNAVKTTTVAVPALLKGERPTGGEESTRVRFELWQASWLMFKEHPWIGDGTRSFSDRLTALNRIGEVSGSATWKSLDNEAFTQPHNEFAGTLANRGIAGGIILILLYVVPLRHFIRRRKDQSSGDSMAANVSLVADMGIATVVGTILFGLTVSVFTSGWMVGLYVLLISTLMTLSRNDQKNYGSPAKRASADLDNSLQIPSPSAQKFLKELYRMGHRRRNRHNAHLWPYMSVSRNVNDEVDRVRVFGCVAPLISIDEAFATQDKDFHIILSGGSVADIDYSRLSGLQALGVNGSLVLQDKFDIEFPYYCVIDRSFARTQRQIMKRIVSEDRVFLLGPDVLRYMLEYIPVDSIRCRLCIIEDVHERAYEPRMTTSALLNAQRHGRDIVLFDQRIPLGFSFESAVGWFDADTVAYTALQAVIWGGARRVYFHGLDIKDAESTPRFYETGTTASRPLTRLEKNFEKYIKPSFRGAIQLLKARGIEVYNLSPDSALGPDIIPFMDWCDLITPTDETVMR